MQPTAVSPIHTRPSAVWVQRAHNAVCVSFQVHRSVYRAHLTAVWIILLGNGGNRRISINVIYGAARGSSADLSLGWPRSPLLLVWWEAGVTLAWRLIWVTVGRICNNAGDRCRLWFCWFCLEKQGDDLKRHEERNVWNQRSDFFNFLPVNTTKYLILDLKHPWIDCSDISSSMCSMWFWDVWSEQYLERLVAWL